jgi:hypothetical protein
MLVVLLVGCGALLASVASYGMAAALIVRVVARLIRGGRPWRGFLPNVMVMMMVTLITAASHLLQIALWAVILLMCGQASGFEEAFYLSAENYTALGYGDIVPTGSWRLLGPLEAVCGLILFGVSTALMFAIMSRLVMNQLRLQLDQVPTPK